MCFNWTVTAVLVVLAIGGLVEAQFEDIPPGDYCGGTSTVRCCDGRVDECSVPLLGSLCYCDQFCNRTNSHSDCCPDYFSACLGITPPDDYNKGSFILNNYQNKNSNNKQKNQITKPLTNETDTILIGFMKENVTTMARNMLTVPSFKSIVTNGEHFLYVSKFDIVPCLRNAKPSYCTHSRGYKNDLKT